MTEKNATNDKRLSELAEDVQLLKLSIESLVGDIAALDEETKERLLDYREKKHSAEIALGSAVVIKQQALQIARQLSDYNNKLKQLRHRAVMLSRYVRYEELSGIHGDIEQIEKLLIQWCDAGKENEQGNYYES